MEGPLVFLKLGGSLITDKARAFTPRPGVIRRIAREIEAARRARPDMRLLIGHGSGSFGHQAAAEYETQKGVRSAREWRGFGEVSVAAARLNRIVTDALAAAGVPVMSFQPSASARCRNGRLVDLAIRPIEEALRHGVVPLIYGDVAFDAVIGGTIVSTEVLFVYLAERLRPSRILLAGSSPGVLDGTGTTIPRITPKTLVEIDALLSGARETDVTGGMADKVTRMAALVEARPTLVVQIFSGLEPGAVYQALKDPQAHIGSRIVQ